MRIWLSFYYKDFQLTQSYYLTDAEKNEIRQDILKIDFSEYSLHFYGNKNQVVGVKLKNQLCSFVFENDEGMIISKLALFHGIKSKDKLSLII